MEIGEWATVDARETWQAAQAHLYGGLGQQAPEKATEAADESASVKTPAGYCKEHETPFKRHSLSENVWWNHKTPDGKRCRGK